MQKGEGRCLEKIKWEEGDVDDHDHYDHDDGDDEDDEINDDDGIDEDSVGCEADDDDIIVAVVYSRVDTL